MKFDELESIDWDAFESTADWSKLLNDLLGLAPAATDSAQRDALADSLDAFADHSSSDELDVIIKLDRAARKAARALRLTSIQERVTALQAASDDFRAAMKEFSAASLALRKESSLLRLEKFNAAVSSLTDAIASLKALSQATADDGDGPLGAAIDQTVNSAQKLRNLLEKPA